MEGGNSLLSKAFNKKRHWSSRKSKKFFFYYEEIPRQEVYERLKKFFDVRDRYNRRIFLYVGATAKYREVVEVIDLVKKAGAELVVLYPLAETEWRRGYEKTKFFKCRASNSTFLWCSSCAFDHFYGPCPAAQLGTDLKLSYPEGNAIKSVAGLVIWAISKGRGCFL